MRRFLASALILGTLQTGVTASAHDLSFQLSAGTGNTLICNSWRIGGVSYLALSTPHFVSKCYRKGLHDIDGAYRLGVAVREANGIFRTLIQIAPNKSFGWAGLAALELKKYELGDPSASLYDALDNAAHADQLKPKLPANQLVTAKAQLLLQCVFCAQAAVQKAARMGLSDSSIMTLRADIDARLGRNTDAISLYWAAVKAARTPLAKSKQYAKLAMYYASQNDLGSARRMFAEAVRKDPINPGIYLQQASFLLYDEGAATAAEHASEQAAQIVVTAEARGLDSLAHLLSWARTEHPPSVSVWQKSFLSPQEALIMAAEYPPLLPLVKVLLRRKLVRDVDSKDGNGNTALLMACRGGNTTAVKMLLRAGATPNVTNRRGDTPLMYAARSGTLHEVRMLLRHGAHVNNLDADGDSALSMAVVARRPQIVKAILKRVGKNFSLGRWTHGDLLVTAARNGDLNTVNVLVKWGISVNSRNSQGETPLIAAVLAGSAKVVGYLLEHGADKTLRYMGYTAAEIAHEKGDPNVLREFTKFSI